MKIFDMHIHAENTEPNPKGLLERWAQVGVFGGCVYSSQPKEQKMEMGECRGLDFDERLSEVLAWCHGYEDRIFPVLWVHPEEEDILSKVEIAAKAGIVAFKMICADYFVYEEKPMALLRKIASLGKPVIFHSGILWDGKASSVYNRPLNWEALIDIEGIRFSMGHCSWPWIDECIAMYGKFLNARTAGKRVEMFFDITPGTPKMYREELFRKLYTLGYNVGDNVMFGLDSSAHDWSCAWAEDWLKTDGRIMDELGISLAYREKLYEKNLLRFLGKTNEAVEIEPPVTDNSHAWSAVNPEVAKIAQGWFYRLGFPQEYVADFENALPRTPVSDAITLAGYDKECENGERNLISYLYLCEKTKEKYKALGLPEQVLYDTLSDLVRWTVEWSNVKGRLYLGQLSWLSRHLGARIFRLGRLQYCMGQAECDIRALGISQGEPIIEVHIPKGPRLTKKDVLRSLAMAREFFAEHFPDYDYKCFTTHSWLLDDTLKKYLPEDSGILTFASLFTPVNRQPSFAMFRYLFAWDTTPQNMLYRHPTSSFAAAVQNAARHGEEFYEVYGAIAR